MVQHRIFSKVILITEKGKIYSLKNLKLRIQNSMKIKKKLFNEKLYDI